jgi:hypothetical protein
MTSARLSIAIRASAYRAEPLARVLPQSDEDGKAKVPSARPAEAVVARPDRLISSPRSTLSGLANPAKPGIHRGFESAHGQSLDMRPLVKGCLASSARNPATAWLNSPVSTWMSARCSSPRSGVPAPRFARAGLSAFRAGLQRTRRRHRAEQRRDFAPVRPRCAPSFGAASALVANYWSGRRDSNPRLQPWQGCVRGLSSVKERRCPPRYPARLPPAQARYRDHPIPALSASGLRP